MLLNLIFFVCQYIIAKKCTNKRFKTILFEAKARLKPFSVV